MKKQLKRDEIDNKYKWDLTSIYKNEEEYKKDLELIKENINKLDNIKSFNDSESLLSYLEFDTNLGLLLEKVSVYTNSLFNAETTSEKYLSMREVVHKLYILYKEKNARIIKELQKLTSKKINMFYENNKELLKYKHDLDEILREKKHLLKENEELLLATLSKNFSLPYEAYECLTDTDFTFGTILVDNEEVELTDANYSIMMQNKSKRVREEAFNMMHEKYKRYSNTLAKLLNAEVETNRNISKIRKYNSPIEYFLFSDNVNEKIVTNLIKCVRGCLPIIKEYYGVKKQLLKLDELHVYDLYVNPYSNNKKYLYEDSHTILSSALSVLGSDYINNLNKAFTESWIDVYNNVGKRSGAYSTGSYLTKPYVLLNYENDYHSLSTLAHELGHSMHTYYSVKNNTPNNYNYSIFIAEIASLVNELLLNKYLIDNAKSSEEKRFYINELLELYRGTLIRQTMFSEFEYNIYQSECVLSNEKLSTLYYDLCKKYLTSEVVIDNLIKYEWARVPHFYYNFYVYKYAIGISIATYIVKNLNDNSFRDKYIKLLSSGGCDYPVNLLKIIDVNLTNSKIFNETEEYIEEKIREFKKEVNENE